MKALTVEAKLRKFALAKVLSMTPSTSSVKYGPLTLRDSEPKRPPNNDWISAKPRLSGICGSDIATVLGSSSRYFEPLTSFPFVPGHEVVADVTLDNDSLSRVVLEPALHCATRGLPPCRMCQVGETNRCESILLGEIKKGIQTGYCSSTGGGWSQEFLAHRSQIHSIPESMSDKDAVMVEPFACALHSVLRIDLGTVNRVAVLGSGTIGLLTTAALRSLSPDIEIVAVAKYTTQKAAAKSLGADQVIEPSVFNKASRRSSASMRGGSWQSHGFDVTFDCVGRSESITQSISATAPGGKVVLAGMPGTSKVDLAPLWHREIELVGSYAYGSEKASETIGDLLQSASVAVDGSGKFRTFELAIALCEKLSLGNLVTHTFSLDNYEEAINLAAQAGARGAIKVAFDPRKKRAREEEKR
ncbi:MAG: zinc-binding dehydrogenase [Acidimicrobiaceae bacterium]|nr:zinc-binding dehydrogenase [Acidimicrobiaceae bacterium]